MHMSLCTFSTKNSSLQWIKERYKFLMNRSESLIKINWAFQCSLSAYFMDYNGKWGTLFLRSSNLHVLQLIKRIRQHKFLLNIHYSEGSLVITKTARLEYKDVNTKKLLTSYFWTQTKQNGMHAFWNLFFCKPTASYHHLIHSKCKVIEGQRNLLQQLYNYMFLWFKQG